MWIKTFQENLINLEYVKQIKCTDSGELQAVMDDGESCKICGIQDIEDHRNKIRTIVQEISDDVITL